MAVRDVGFWWFCKFRNERHIVSALSPTLPEYLFLFPFLWGRGFAFAWAVDDGGNDCCWSSWWDSLFSRAMLSSVGKNCCSSSRAEKNVAYKAVKGSSSCTWKVKFLRWLRTSLHLVAWVRDVFLFGGKGKNAMTIFSYLGWAHWHL